VAFTGLSISLECDAWPLNAKFYQLMGDWSKVERLSAMLLGFGRSGQRLERPRFQAGEVGV
jgi:hypothetical protein